ncbi:hypothetical protein TNCV_2757871 [Trichonephila clavipes]|nr:hypothetical protein TNCV_2757871 [Trichonephila clavipes]
MPSTSSSVSTVSTSSSSTQAHLLPSTSAWRSLAKVGLCAIKINTHHHPSTSAIPTIQRESLLPIPNLITTFPGNNQNTSASSLETETRLLATSNKFATLSTEIQPLVPLPESLLHPIVNILMHLKSHSV